LVPKLVPKSPGPRRALPTSFNGTVVIREQSGRVFYEAKWRDSRGRQVKRRVGPAWVERGGGGGWRRRGGRVPDGCFDEKAAIVEMSRLIEVHEEELAAGPPRDGDRVRGRGRRAARRALRLRAPGRAWGRTQRAVPSR